MSINAKQRANDGIPKSRAEILPSLFFAGSQDSPARHCRYLFENFELLSEFVTDSSENQHFLEYLKPENQIVL